MEPEIVSIPAFTVVGLKYRGRNEHDEIPQLWDEFIPRSGEIKNRLNAHLAYGVQGNFDEDSGEFDYVAGFDVEDAAEPPAGMVSWEVPEQTYAVFPCTLQTIKETFRAIYESWLPGSGYRPADGPDFELYNENFNPDAQKWDMFIYIPVE